MQHQRFCLDLSEIFYSPCLTTPMEAEVFGSQLGPWSTKYVAWVKSWSVTKQKPLKVLVSWQCRSVLVMRLYPDLIEYADQSGFQWYCVWSRDSLIELCFWNIIMNRWWARAEIERSSVGAVVTQHRGILQLGPSLRPKQHRFEPGVGRYQSFRSSFSGAKRPNQVAAVLITLEVHHESICYW